MYPPAKITQSIFSFLMVIDMLLTFLTAYKKEIKIEFEEDEVKQRKGIYNKLKSFNKVEVIQDI